MSAIPDQPAPFGAPYAQRERGETVPGAHLAAAVARVADETAGWHDGRIAPPDPPRREDDPLDTARGFFYGMMFALAAYAFIILAVLLAIALT